MAKIYFELNIVNKIQKLHMELKGQDLYFFEKSQEQEGWIKDFVKNNMNINNIEIKKERLINE